MNRTKDQCIVVTWLAPDQPGFLDFAYRVRALAKAYRVTLVSPYALTQPEFDIVGVEHRVLPRQDSRRGWIFYLFDCARLIWRSRPACVVLLHTMVAPLAHLIPGVPAALYWNEHPSRFTASPPGHPLFKRLARKLALKLFFMWPARRVALVMPIGEAHCEDLLRIGCRQDRVRVMYMGVDRAFLVRDVPRRRDDGAPLELIYSGTVNQLRGRDVMLEAVALANRDGTIARLHIVGASQDQIDYCKQYAERLGIADCVHVRGRVAGDEIPRLLCEADLGLCFMEDLPWWRFNPPTKLFEFLVAGLPVLASDIRTHTAYLSHGYNGMICGYDSQSLADAIGHIWHCRASLPQMQVAARASGERYLWDRIEPEFLEAIRSIARRSARPEPAMQAARPVLAERQSPADSASGKS